MRMLRLPRVAELGDRSLLSLRDEDRIEAEPFGPARLVDDPPAQRPGAAHLAAVRRDRHQLRDVARVSPRALDPIELAEHPPDLVAVGAARRAHPWAPAHAVHLDAAVLAHHPRFPPPDLAAQPRLPAPPLPLPRPLPPPPPPRPAPP